MPICSLRQASGPEGVSHLPVRSVQAFSRLAPFSIVSPLALLALLACGGKEPGPAPTKAQIKRFVANRTTLAPGESVILEATYSGGTAIVDPGGHTLPSGGRLTLRPELPTTYVLTVRVPAGQRGDRSPCAADFPKGDPGGSCPKHLCATASCTVTVQTTLRIVAQGLPPELHSDLRLVGPIHRTAGERGLPPERAFSGPCGPAHPWTLENLPTGDYELRTLPPKTATPARGGAEASHLPWMPVRPIRLLKPGDIQTRYLPCRLELPLGEEEQPPLSFRLVPAGSFLMGRDLDPEGPPPPAGAERLSRGPAHAVAFQRAFYLARRPLTRGQWTALTGDPRPPRPDEPMAGLSWSQAHHVLLPALTLRLPGHGFRLPSEAEWEYAWRLSEAAPRLDLEDFHGGVAQWCQDLAHADYLGAPADGSAWEMDKDKDKGKDKGKDEAGRKEPPKPESPLLPGLRVLRGGPAGETRGLEETPRLGLPEDDGPRSGGLPTGIRLAMPGLPEESGEAAR